MPLVKVDLLKGRSAEEKAAGVVGGDDVFVLITEIGRADVSFGRGLAQRAPTSQSAGGCMSVDSVTGSRGL